MPSHPWLLLLAVSLFTLSPSCSSMKKSSQPPLKTVSHVDLPRFMGDWYIIANIPYALEKGKVGTLEYYALRPDGKIDNIFKYRKKTLDAPLKEWKAVAWVHNKETNAEWRVQLLWPFKLPYLIIDLDPQYQWAALGYPSRKLAWVLSREPVLDEAIYQGILKRMGDQGYDTALLQKVPQRPVESKR